jgi:hypothetical protein
LQELPAERVDAHSGAAGQDELSRRRQARVAG